MTLKLRTTQESAVWALAHVQAAAATQPTTQRCHFEAFIASTEYPGQVIVKRKAHEHDQQ